MNIINIAKQVFEIESNEILNLSKNISPNFEKVANSIFNCSGKIIFCGIGKSGIVGKKIASTFSSTGTPSFFIHPSEAFHGDLGMIGKEDIVLFISYSGETDELLKIIPFLKYQKIKTISMCGNSNSTLVKNTDLYLNVSVSVEACPLQLAPTSSATALMVMGDALAIALMKLRKFSKDNFARFHPGGSLGKRLVQNVSQVMKKENLPIIKSNENIKKVINTISAGKCGIVVIIINEIICGVISDGDIRRAMEFKENNFFKLKAFDIMTKNPQSVYENTKLKTAGDLMFLKKINSLLVKDQQELLVGIVQSYDLGI